MSNPRFRKDPTADSINGILEFFFAAFTDITGTETEEKDRSEVYNISFRTEAHMMEKRQRVDNLKLVRKSLTEEGLVVNTHYEKHNFVARDLTRVLLTLRGLGRHTKRGGSFLVSAISGG